MKSNLVLKKNWNTGL